MTPVPARIPAPRLGARRPLAVIAAVAALSLVPVSGAAAADTDGPSDWSAQTIASGGTGGFPYYRIPAVVQLPDGTILASYDGRPLNGDAPNPNSILQRRSTDGGRTWGEQTVISQGRVGADKIGYSDPSYVYDSTTGTLFNFHVYSKDAGFPTSIEGDDDADRRILSAVVAVSTDGGATWEHRLITDVVKPAGVVSTFATSGAGIQISRGPHAGRLVQQYAGKFTDGTIKAYSVYSDDHGATWTMGRPTGTAMDENKVVELSDGRLMMNSRANSGPKARLVSYSEDGGASWSQPKADDTLIDPRNNGSIIRKNPGAAPGTREASELLFSNSASTTARTTGTVRYSCDDGETWPVAKVYEPGNHSYSQLVALADGTYGNLYETRPDREIAYGTFGDAWLQPFCARFDTARATIAAGSTGSAPVTIRNDDSEALPAGRATASGLPSGWTAGTVDVPALAPGESATVSVPITVGSTQVAGAFTADVRVTAGRFALRGDLEVTVDVGAAPTIGAAITGARADGDRDLATRPYAAGEQVPYTFRVTSTGSIAETVAPASGPFAPFVPPGPGNCRWTSLAPGAAYSCTTPRHLVTESELADGYFVADSVWTISASGQADVRLPVSGGEVDLLVRAPALELTRTAELVDADGDGFASAGDSVRVTTTARNSGNVRLQAVEGAVAAGPLAPGQTASSESVIALTAADIAAGSVTIPAAAATGSNGSKTAEAHLGETAMELEVQPEAPQRFSDVAPGDMFYDEISWLAERGITTGYPDGTFRPTASVNRDAMAAYLYRMAGSPAVTAPRSQPFSDVTPGMEHYDAIIWAYQNGIVKGWPDGTFRPTTPITRDAMAAFVHRYAGSPQLPAPGAAVFADVPAGSQFAAEIAWMKQEGITTGWPDGTYRPLSTTQRDAMAAFLFRMENPQDGSPRIAFRSQQG